MDIRSRVRVRRAHERDADAIAALRETAFRALAAETYGPEEIEALLGARSIRPRAARKDFVVELAGEIVACGTAVIDGPRSASLEALAVDPRFARRGLATLIVEGCRGGSLRRRRRAGSHRRDAERASLLHASGLSAPQPRAHRQARGAAVSPIVVHLSKTLLPAPARLRHSRRAAIAAVH
jgi:GNAT superfamily N-acetyltransferase